MKDQIKKELEDKCFNYEVDPSTGGLALDIEDAEYLINKAFKEGEKKGREDDREDQFAQNLNN